MHSWPAPFCREIPEEEPFLGSLWAGRSHKHTVHPFFFFSIFFQFFFKFFFFRDHLIFWKKWFSLFTLGGHFTFRDNARELVHKILLFDEHETTLINWRKDARNRLNLLMVTLDASSKTPRCVMTIGWNSNPCWRHEKSYFLRFAWWTLRRIFWISSPRFEYASVFTTVKSPRIVFPEPRILWAAKSAG